MAKHQQFYSPSQLASLTNMETNSAGSPVYDEQGFPKRSVNLGSIYSKHAAKNDFGGTKIRDARSIMASSGNQIHEYTESVLRFVHKNHPNMAADGLEAIITKGIAENEARLTHHVPKVYAPKIAKLVTNVVNDTYMNKQTGSVYAPGSVIFSSEQDLYSVLDSKKGLGIHGKPDMVFYNKETNTVEIKDLKTVYKDPGSNAAVSEHYNSGLQAHSYAVLVHDNFEKITGLKRPDNVKYEFEYLIVPPDEKSGRGFIKTKTQYFDESSLQKSKAYLLSQIVNVQDTKQKIMRHEEIGGSAFVKQYLSSILGPSECKPGACSMCPMHLYCPNRNYQELVDEINNGIPTKGTKQLPVSERQQEVTQALEADANVSVDYEAAMGDIRASKQNAKMKALAPYADRPETQVLIDNEYTDYAKVMPALNPDISDNIRGSYDPDGNANAFNRALGSQEGLPVSILDKDLHPRWMNQKYGQQFAEHIQSFAKSVASDTAARFSISPKALTDTVMERVFQSKKLAEELDGIVAQTVKNHFSLQSKMSFINPDDVHKVVDNIGGFLKDTRLVRAVGEHVQMSTLSMINQMSADTLKTYMKDNHIYQRQGESAAEALRWHISNTGNYEEAVQSTFEKIHRSPSFRGILSNFSLSEKRFPLPMLAASMLLSYAGAQTMAQTQAKLAINKGEDYRRYQNEEIREGEHAGVMSMALRLASSAFGSGFQQFRTTYQDIVNKTLMNNRLFKMFKDATSKAIVKKEDLTLEGGIVRKFMESSNSVKMFAAAGFVGAVALPLIKSNREIGKNEDARAKRLRKAKYGKTKSTGDSTTYQKGSDLRHGYKEHTGFGSPFNIGVFETFVIGLNRIVANTLPDVIDKARSLEGKTEAFFLKKSKEAVSTVRKSARAQTIESINDNHTQAVLSRQYEDMNTLRSGEMRTLDVAKAQREADFHTFGIERANTSTNRLESQLTAFKIQENIAPNRLAATVEKKARDAARLDAPVAGAVQRERVTYSDAHIASTEKAAPPTIYPRHSTGSDKMMVEGRQIKHDHSETRHSLSNEIPHITPKTNLRVTEPKKQTGAIIPRVEHHKGVSIPVRFKNMMTTKYTDVRDFIGTAKTRAKNISSSDIERFLSGNVGKEVIGFSLSQMPDAWRSRSQVSHAVLQSTHAVVNADMHQVARSSGFNEYRNATAAERQVSKKATSEENRKRFRRQMPFF